jgi:hypothetical protein
MCDYYNLQKPQSPTNPDNLRKTYLNELDSAGWVGSLEVRIGNTKKAYYPIVVPSITSSFNLEEKSQETQETTASPKFFQFHKIDVPKYFNAWPKNWLVLQILGLWKCGIEIGNGQYSIDNYNDAIQFLSIESKLGYTRNGISMRQFSGKYDPCDTLSQHFSGPIFEDSYNRIFGNLEYIGTFRDNDTKNSGSYVDSLLS